MKKLWTAIYLFLFAMTFEQNISGLRVPDGPYEVYPMIVLGSLLVLVYVLPFL